MEVKANATVLLILYCTNMTPAGAENVAERIQYPDLACMSRSTQHAQAHARIQWLKVLPTFDLSTVPPRRMCHDGLTFNTVTTTWYCVDRLIGHVHFVVDGVVSLTRHLLNTWKSFAFALLHNQR